MEKQSQRPLGRLRKPKNPRQISSNIPNEIRIQANHADDQAHAINPITVKPMFRTSDEVLEEALEVFYQHLKGKKVV